jgi:UDP:flavonoid glycosyltransferase YjiC (YdhE family)
MKERILFVAENVTLAQVVRLVVLARSLDPARYEIHFASSSFEPMVFDGLPFERHSLFTLEKSAVEKALAAGKRLYEKKALLGYVQADLEVIQSVQPSLIVGDFRLSLSISAPVSRIPHATLINAYWSPFRREQRFPVPDHPIIRLLGEELTEQYFPKAIGKVFDHFAAPINAVRKRYGLPRVGSLQQVLVQGDYTLYPDTPRLVPTEGAPAHHGYLGPVLWSPPVAFDERSLTGDDSRPLVYVTLGSSGSTQVLPNLMSALGSLPVRVLLATAGRAELGSLPKNVTAHAFVPGDQVARQAALVISNGGSTTGYQALAEGTPVLGLPSNLDQFLATQAIERTGAGLRVKARAASEAALRHAVVTLLSEPSYTRAAQSVAGDFAEYPASQRFARFVHGALEAERHRSAQRGVEQRGVEQRAVSG